MNTRSFVLPIIVVVIVPGVAHAQQPAPGCPPGSWYCAEATEKPAAPSGTPASPSSVRPLPAPASGELPTLPSEPPPQNEAPPVYARAPSQALPPPNPDRPAHYEYRPRPHAWYRRNEFGINLNGQLAFAKTTMHDAPMTMLGLGAALRYRIIPWLAFEGGINVAAGQDAWSRTRTEVSGSLAGLVFFNPQNRVQLYGVGGLTWTSASIRDAYTYAYDYGDYSQHYGYFGGLLGLGLEARITPHIAINGDLRVFMRTRTDAEAAYYPEFYNPTTGTGSNTSAGAYLNAGITLYF